MLRTLFSVLFLASTCMAGFAQNKMPYAEDVQAIKRFDQMYPQPERPLLFTGSSSIRLWKDFNRKFGKLDGLNRGIGGALVNDIIYYAKDLIFDYNPKKIVLYIGENDLPNESTTADSVLNRVRRLYFVIRSKLPDVPIVYIAMKPSPSRDQYQTKAREANASIKNFFEKQRNVTFLDIYTPMLTNGKSRPELFLEDQLHMNEKGYAIWEKKLARLIKD